MQGVIQEQAALYRAQQILKRLQPLVADIFAEDLAGRRPASETAQLQASLMRSLQQMQNNLDHLGFPADNQP